MSDTNADASNTNAESVFSTSKSQPPLSSFDSQSVIKDAKDQDLIDPVEVLKFLQKEIVTGRALEITSCEETTEGETNYITVDRANILETTISELDCITNYRLTFQVDFMREECVDQDGPRKEWIRLMNQHCAKLKAKYLGPNSLEYGSAHAAYAAMFRRIRLRLTRNTPGIVYRNPACFSVFKFNALE